MIHTIITNDQRVFEDQVNDYVSKGYKISSTQCGYVGEVGSSVYDCEYWMAILVKD